MSGNVRLIATQGADEVNHGGRRYRVWNDGHVDVPPEAVGPLIDKGGFVLADPPVTPEPTGMVAVRHASDPTASCAYGVPDQNGIITVPAAAVPALAAHGFHPVSAQPPKDAADAAAAE